MHPLSTSAADTEAPLVLHACNRAPQKRGKQTKKTNKSLGKTTIAKQTTAQRRKATIEADAGSSRDSDSDTDTNTASDSDTNTDSDSKSDSASTSTSAYIGN
jgi:hypothetical protein